MPPKALAVPTSQRAWRDLFDEFLTKLRIDSKETVAEDERGSELEMWGSQRMFLDNICIGLDQGKREFLCLKARQLGVSTISLAILLFWLAMHPGLQAALVVDTEENREKFRLTIHRYIQSFPKKFFGDSFAIKKGKDNRAFTHFTNGSNLDYLVAGKRKKTLGESRAYNCALLTECANYGDPDGLNSFVNTLAQTHPDRLYLWESTAKGYNHWHDMWLEAGRDTLTKHRFFIGWWSKDINAYSPRGPAPQPALFKQYSQETLSREESEMIDAVKKRYGVTITQGQLAWYRHQQSNVSVREESMHQNLPWVEEQAFVLTGYSFFQTRVLQKDMSRIQGLEPGSEPVKFKGYRFWIGEDFFSTKMEQVRTVDEVELRIWEEPSKHGDYVIGCDPAFGRNDNKDRHCCEVYRCYADKLVQVAEYAVDNVETRQAAWVLAYLAGTYRNCICNLELTGGPGLAVLAEFNNLRNQLNAEMYSQRVKDLDWEDFLNNARWFLYHKSDSLSGAGYVAGWKTSRDNKFEIMNQLRDLHVTNVLILHSLPLTEEMLTFVQDGGELGALGTNKDDRVFASALASRAFIDWVRGRMLSANMTFARVQSGEAGDNSDPGVVDRIVADFFRRAEERANEGSEPPRWMKERGLA
jgi:hypothetical protein